MRRTRADDTDGEGMVREWNGEGMVYTQMLIARIIIICVCVELTLKVKRFQKFTPT